MLSFNETGPHLEATLEEQVLKFKNVTDTVPEQLHTPSRRFAAGPERAGGRLPHPGRR